MKKITLLVASLFAMGIAHAQDSKPTYGFEKGSKFVEGNFSFSSTNDKEVESKENTFIFNPKFGYFVNDKFAVGAELAYASAKSEQGSYEEKGTGLGLGVFGRYYFLDLGERFKTYGEFGIGFMNTKFEESIGSITNDVKLNAFGAGLTLGVNYFVTENIAINFALADIMSYTSEKYDYDGAEATNSFYLGFGEFNNFFATAQFGLTYKF